MQARKGVDTHDVIVQASSAQLIQLLQSNYSNIDMNAQGSLLYYLQTLIDPTVKKEEVELERARKNPSISETIAVAEAIAALPLSFEEKQRVLLQMQFIANTYPGGRWDMAVEQWSQNRFYNPNIQQEEILMTPPAHALNLVCRALLDKGRYNSKDGEEDLDQSYRINSFYNLLLEQRKEVEKGELQKCSAGLQHDLLYLLNLNYLGLNGKPIHLLMDTSAFFQESLVSFIDEQINAHPGEETNKMIIAWMRWKTEASPEEECPLIVWLRKQFPTPEQEDEGWKEASKAYLKARCESFFLNPMKSPLNVYVQQIPESAVPSSQNAITPLIDEIIRMNHLPIPSGPMNVLVGLRNQALTLFKSEIQTKGFKGHEQQIQELYSALTIVSSLYHYRDLTVFLGQVDLEFKLSGQKLIYFLTTYFQNYNFENRRTPGEVKEFDNLTFQYRNQEKGFIQQNNVDFVSNFFHIINRPEGFGGPWLRLLALQPETAPNHPLKLTDEMIEQATTLEGDAVYLTPYAVNRFLLHGLLTQVEDWSTVYCRNLIQLIQWLTIPSPNDEPLNLRTLKKSYSSTLLTDLLFLALMKQSEIDDELKNEFINLPDHAVQILLGKKLFLNIMQNRDLTIEERGQILNALEGHLRTFIQNCYDIATLFRLSQEELNEEQRTQIWTAVADHLGTLIQNGNELAELLDLSSEELNEGQRLQIWNAVSDHLEALIQTGDEITGLFLLSCEQLNEAQRMQIWAAVAGRLGAIIQDGEELACLFKLSREQLNETQRTQIWTAIAGQLGAIIQNGEELAGLFQLSREQLSEEQRTQIWTAIAGQLGAIIQNGEELVGLLQLSREQLSEEQRMQIFNSLAGQLGTLIQNSYLIAALFGLSQEQLNEEQRAQIWAAVAGQLDNMIQDAEELRCLLQLSPDQLNRERRTEIWASVVGNLGYMIQDVYQLGELLKISADQLNKEQRAEIWAAVAGNLGDMIQDSEELLYLFQLSHDQLDVKQRRQILYSIGEEKLNALVPIFEERKQIIESAMPKKPLFSEQPNFFSLRQKDSSSEPPETKFTPK